MAFVLLCSITLHVGIILRKLEKGELTFIKLLFCVSHGAKSLLLQFIYSSQNPLKLSLFRSILFTKKLDFKKVNFLQD